MIQEIISGPASNMYNYTLYINSESCISAGFLRIKVRQYSPEFGITRVGISKNRVLEAEEFTEKLLKKAEFTGLATAEYKKDPRDEQLKLLEINARTTRSNWHAHTAV